MTENSVPVPSIPAPLFPPVAPFRKCKGFFHILGPKNADLFEEMLGSGLTSWNVKMMLILGFDHTLEN